MTSKVAGDQAIFEWKYMFFQLLSTTKVKIVDEMMQSAYLYVILHNKHKNYRLSFRETSLSGDERGKTSAVRRLDFNLTSNSW